MQQVVGRKVRYKNVGLELEGGKESLDQLPDSLTTMASWFSGRHFRG